MEEKNSSMSNFFEMIMGIVVWVDIAIFMINTIESKFNTGLCLIALAFVSFIIYRSWKRTRQKSNDYTSNYVKETTIPQPEPPVSSDTDNSSVTESTQVKELTEIAQMNLFTGFDPQRKVKEYTQVYPLCLKAFANLLVSPYNEDILETYVSKWGIPDEYASAILELPNAKKLITVNKEKLPTSAVLKMYTLPNALELFEEYVTKHELRIVEEFAMYEQPNAAGFVAVSIKYRDFSSCYTERKMLYLPNALELFASYTKEYYVYKETVKAMFKLPDAAKFAEILIRNEGYEDEEFEYSDYLNLLRLSNAKDLLMLLMEQGHNNDELADAILASPYATELVTIFDDKGEEFDEKQQEKLFKLDVREVQMKYLLNPKVCEEVEEAAFTSPYAEDLLARIIAKKQELNWYSEVLMCQMPNAENFVTAYTEYTELCDDAQMELFELPNAKAMVISYHEKHELCEEAKAYAQAKGWLSL